MFKAMAAAGILSAAFLTTACNGSSPTAPSVKREVGDGRVEPPGVLSAPNGEGRAVRQSERVEPPGVL